MENTSIDPIFRGAKSLSGSPLGIIALFILLVYGFAALTFGVSIASLGAERIIIVWFLVGFPVLVLLIFTLLVIRYHKHLYGPTDFVDQADFLRLQEMLSVKVKENEMLKEVSHVVLPPVAARRLLTMGNESIAPLTFTYPDDPQKNRWGGSRDANSRSVVADRITPLKTDSSFFNVPLRVISTDPENRPLTGTVRFYLHDSFNPDVDEVQVKNGVAKLNLVAYGAFTVGVETDDGTKLEIDLSDADIDAPIRFKQN